MWISLQVSFRLTQHTPNFKVVQLCRTVPVKGTKNRDARCHHPRNNFCPFSINGLLLLVSHARAKKRLRRRNYKTSARVEFRVPSNIVFMYIRKAIRETREHRVHLSKNNVDWSLWKFPQKQNVHNIGWSIHGFGISPCPGFAIFSTPLERRDAESHSLIHVHWMCIVLLSPPPIFLHNNKQPIIVNTQLKEQETLLFYWGLTQNTLGESLLVSAIYKYNTH